MKKHSMPNKNESVRNPISARMAQNSCDQWKWMAAGLAASAASAASAGPSSFAPSQTQVFNLSGNYLSESTNNLSLNFDTGNVGQMHASFSSSFYALQSSSHYAKAGLKINSASFVGKANEVLHVNTYPIYSTFFIQTTSEGGGFSTFTQVGVSSTSFWEDSATAIASSSSNSGYSINGSISEYIYGSVQISFSDPNINHGENTSAELSVLVSGSTEGVGQGAAASVELVSLTYQLSVYSWLQQLDAQLNSLLSPSNDKKTNQDLSKAIAAINQALAKKNWQSGLLAPAKEVFGNSAKAIQALTALTKDSGASSTIVADARAAMGVIVSANIQLAGNAITAAINAHANPTKIAKANQSLTLANSSATAGNNADAIAHASKAWQAAQFK